ncbi:HofP DNA utilization family protein [Kosakonia cowanii]|uniref:HofP DNA utilization family protein n=1 Tax=Kosakonia cowanii TaxID=208223 RepID=UPI0023F8D677|nr:HofP DNA utilization family protein [Kosakonia cowanii]MDF7758412.1 HofP DNA utilization family protein [Kosakonia cowanii]
MIAKRLLFTFGMVCVLCGMRDPFQPPPDRCQLAQLHAWQLHGVIESGQRLAIIRDAAGRWHRVRVGDTLSPGWRVTAIDADETEITTGKSCAPSTWRWKRKGTQDAKIDSEHRTL